MVSKLSDNLVSPNCDKLGVLNFLLSYSIGYQNGWNLLILVFHIKQIVVFLRSLINNQPVYN